MTDLFSIANIAFHIPLPGHGGADTYAMSWVELISTLLALAAVIGARLNKSWWYAAGILNSIGFIAIFYQVQLYSDLLLNVYFIAISIFGWWVWTRQNLWGDYEYPIRELSVKASAYMTAAIAALTLLLGATIDMVFGTVTSLFVDGYVHTPAAMPFTDAVTTVMSVFAMYLLAKRYVESWVLWILIDIVCVFKYAQSGVIALSVIYAVFLLNAIFALYQWNKLKEV